MVKKSKKAEELIAIIEGAQEDGVWTIIYEALHAQAIEFGTDPHYPGQKGVDRLEGWARRKLGLSPEEAKEAAQAIAWKIFHKGTDPQPFLRPALDLAKAHALNHFSNGGTFEEFADFIFAESQDNIIRNETSDEGTLLKSGKVINPSGQTISVGGGAI